MSTLIRFLLVEDDENHATLVKRSLKKERIENHVDHVLDGEEALKFLRKEGEYKDSYTPDIVLLDLKLPKVDGHEVLREIKQDKELQKIPVVVLTTSRAEADRLKAYELKANSYLVKPIDFTKFKEMVSDLSLYWGVWNIPPKD